MDNAQNPPTATGQTTFAFPGGRPRWKPQKEKAAWQVVLAAVMGAVVIGLTSSSVLALLIPFALIGTITLLFFWYKPHWGVFVTVLFVIFAHKLRFVDPLAVLLFGILMAQVILYGRKLVTYPVTYLIVLYYSYSFIGLLSGENTAHNLDIIITAFRLFILYFIIINLYKGKKNILTLAFWWSVMWLPFAAFYNYLVVSGELGEFLRSAEVVAGFVKVPDANQLYVTVYEWIRDRTDYSQNILFSTSLLLYIAWGTESKMKRNVCYALFLIYSGSVVVCGSRGGMLGLLLLFMFVVIYERRRKIVWVMTIVALIAGIFLVPIVFASRWNKKSDEAGSIYEDYSGYTRKEMLRCGLLMIQDNLFFGVGQGNFAMAIERDYWKPIWIPESFKGLEAHNMYVHQFAESGIFFFSIFMLYIFLVLYSFHYAEKYWTGKDEQLMLLNRGAKLGFVVWLFCALLLSQSQHRFLWCIMGFAGVNYLQVKRHMKKTLKEAREEEEKEEKKVAEKKAA